MTGEHFWWSYWYFHLPNYALSAVFYTLLGRLLLGLFVPPTTSNYIYRWFRLLTDWVVRPVTFITPRAVPAPLIPLAAAFWIAAVRVAFFMVMYNAGLTPRVGGPG